MSVEVVPGGQSRLDILRAELVRRSATDEQDVAGLLAGLPAILSDDSPGTFSAVPRVQVPSRAGEHRRRVERLVSDETIARPDLVILDLTMPRLDGLRACQALRSDPDLAGTRVLVLTGRDQPDDRAAARDAGADAYLVKPFSSLALLDAVKRLTDG
jgi:CheY-like chemotaxis protein